MTLLRTAGAVLLFDCLAVSLQAQELGAPTALAQQVTSLRRSSPDWDVRTTIWLRADATEFRELSFDITSPPAKGTLICNKECATGKCQPGEPHAGDPPASISRSCRCEYLPTPGESGPDYFYYVAKTIDATTTVRSQPAKVDIDIKTRGLRWELVPAGTTGLSNDTNSLQDVPAVFGKTAQDFLFVLNWLTDFPDQNIVPGRNPSGGFLSKGDLVSPVSRSLNIALRTGLVTTPATVDAVDSGRIVTAPGPPPTATLATATTAALTRSFMVGGEVNLNAVWKFDGAGAFVELGAAGRGTYEVAAQSEDTEIEFQRLFVLLQHAQSAIRFEGGVRFALKRDAPSEATTLLVNGNRVEHGRNPEELIVIESGFARDTALADLPAGGGDSRNRWYFRFIATPEIPMLPPNVRPTIGVETTQAIGGGAPITRFIYGANLGFK